MQWPLCFVYFFQSLLVHCDYCYQKHKPSFHTFFLNSYFHTAGLAYFKTFLSTTFNPPPIELIIPPIRPHEIFYKSPEFYWMSVQSITLSYLVPTLYQYSEIFSPDCCFATPCVCLYINRKYMIVWFAFYTYNHK